MKNWYRRLKAEADGELDWGVLDTQLLCCGYEANRRQPGEEYTPKEGRNWPEQPPKPRLEDSRVDSLLP